MAHPTSQCPGQAPTTKSYSAPNGWSGGSGADVEGVSITPGVPFLALLCTEGQGQKEIQCLSSHKPFASRGAHFSGWLLNRSLD